MLGQIVPERLELDRGRDVARIPEQHDHLAERVHRTATRECVERSSDDRGEHGRIGMVAVHEGRERLGGVEWPVVPRPHEFVDGETAGHQFRFERGSMGSGCDHDNGPGVVERGSEELRNSGDQLVVAVIEADDMVMHRGFEFRPPSSTHVAGRLQVRSLQPSEPPYPGGAGAKREVRRARSPGGRPTAQPSRTTSRAALSSRMPRYAGWRILPPAVHSAKRTSATYLGSTKCAARGTPPPANEDSSRSSGKSIASRRSSSFSENPVPTLPAYRSSPSSS